MKGIINKITSTLFAALFVLMGCSALVFGGALSLEKGDGAAQVVASAATDEYKSYPRYDGTFEFGESTNVSFAGYPNKNPTIEFNLVITNPEKFELDDEDDVSIFHLDVVRTANGKDVPIYTLLIASNYMKNEVWLGHKRLDIKGEVMDDLSILPGAIELVPDQVTGEYSVKTKEDSTSAFWDARESKVKEEGFVLDKVISTISKQPFKTHTNGNDAGAYKGYQMLDLKLTVESIYSEYFITSKGLIRNWYETTESQWVSPFKKEEVSVKKYRDSEYRIKSPTWSVSSALQQMQDEGRLTAANLGVSASTFETVSGYAGTPEMKTITVKYLEQIGNSPFATQKKAKVAVPMTDGKPVYDDICSAMGNTSLKCLGATVAGFEQDTFDVYTAKYESSFYLQVKQEDGHYDEAYLKLEKSLDEFVNGLVERDIFEAGTFSYALNDIRTKYPECESYESDEIYGLWGYVVVPETTSLNSVFADLLRVDPEYPAIINRFEENGTVKAGPYRDMLKSEYDYGWWSSLTSWFFTWLTNELTAPVQHVFFYADLKETEGGIDKSAGTDGSTLDLIGKGIGDALGSLTDTIGKLFQKEDSKDKTLRSILVLSGVVTVAGAAVAIAYLWYKKK